MVRGLVMMTWGKYLLATSAFCLCHLFASVAVPGITIIKFFYCSHTKSNNIFSYLLLLISINDYSFIDKGHLDSWLLPRRWHNCHKEATNSPRWQLWRREEESEVEARLDPKVLPVDSRVGVTSGYHHCFSAALGSLGPASFQSHDLEQTLFDPGPWLGESPIDKPGTDT